MNILLVILLVILIFGLIITFHEFGHFIVAKLCKVTVNEFSIGMGPTLFKFVKGETKYAVRLLPFGGFVSMEGEDATSDDTNAFCNKHVLKRIAVVVAGSFMNLLLGFLVVVILSCNQEYISSNVISQFAQDAQSQSQGLQVGDKIIKVNGTRTYVDNDIVSEFSKSEDTTFDFVVKRGNKKIELSNVDLKDSETGKIKIDFSVTALEKNLVNTLDYSARKTVSVAKLIWNSLADMVKGNISLDQVTGPIGVTQSVDNVLDSAKEQGIGLFAVILTIIAFLTVNIGIFNLLPIPALDGGRLLFLLIELIIRKKVPAKYESAIHLAGFAFLIILTIVIAFNDILRLFGI